MKVQLVSFSYAVGDETDVRVKFDDNQLCRSNVGCKAIVVFSYIIVTIVALIMIIAIVIVIIIIEVIIMIIMITVTTVIIRTPRRTREKKGEMTKKK